MDRTSDCALSNVSAASDGLAEDRDTKIIFRQICTDVPQGWPPGRLWYVEHHSSRFMSLGGMGLVHERADAPSKFVLGMVFVNELYRQEGIATQIVNACIEQWPGIEITGPVSITGGAFIENLPADVDVVGRDRESNGAGSAANAQTCST